jgi:peptidoglycan/xylan/chitin deacetylase (PgdA/CDA1 family)
VGAPHAGAVRQRDRRESALSDTLVLCYHGVSEGWPADFSISPGRLADQVRWFVGRGFRPATFTDAITGRAEGDTLVVTFDDAYRSVGRLARPLLDELGVPATVFVPTAFAGAVAPRPWEGVDVWIDTEWGGEVAVMDWPELRELAEAGWEVGSHTRTHPRLPELGDAELAREIADSREETARGMDRPCRSLAYPYGAFDGRVAGATRAAGYEAACGLLPGPVSARDPLRVPRISVVRDWPDETLRRRARPWYRRLQSSRVWPLVPPLVSLVKRVPGVGGS